jgi:hypothetical protein
LADCLGSFNVPWPTVLAFSSAFSTDMALISRAAPRFNQKMKTRRGVGNSRQWRRRVDCGGVKTALLRRHQGIRKARGHGGR